MPKKPHPPTPAARFVRLKSRDEADAIMLNVAIPRALHRRVKMAGIQFNFSLSHIAREALTAWLDQHEGSRR